MNILVTGSTAGLGYLMAKELMAEGNNVILHARNQEKAQVLKKELPQAKGILIGDLGNKAEVVDLAQAANKLGRIDTVIHNAGIYTSKRKVTFEVNVLAPYLLIALMKRPQRIIFTSSDMHMGARLNLDHLEEQTDYSSSKLQVLLLAKSLARLDQDIIATAVDPGWVPTKMGGAAASDDLVAGYTTQVKLATLNDPKVSGGYFYHLQRANYDSRVDKIELQDEYLSKLEELTNLTIRR